LKLRNKKGNRPDRSNERCDRGLTRAMSINNIRVLGRALHGQRFEEKGTGVGASQWFKIRKRRTKSILEEERNRRGGPGARIAVNVGGAE